MTQKLNWLVRQTTEAEIQVVSVERIKEYSEIQPEVCLSLIVFFHNN